MDDEYELINAKSFRDKKTIDRAKDVTYIDTTNRKSYLYDELSKIQFRPYNKALSLAKTSLIPLLGQDSQTLGSIIKRQLIKFLPNFLKEAISVTRRKIFKYLNYEKDILVTRLFQTLIGFIIIV